MSAKQHVSRRPLLSSAAGTAAGVIGFPYVIHSSVLGNEGTVSPSERLTMGCIGIGSQGGHNMRQFLGENDCRIVAIWDVDENHPRDAVDTVNKKYGNSD